MLTESWAKPISSLSFDSCLESIKDFYKKLLSNRKKKIKQSIKLTKRNVIDINDGSLTNRAIIKVTVMRKLDCFIFIIMMFYQNVHQVDRLN